MPDGEGTPVVKDRTDVVGRAELWLVYIGEEQG